MVITIYKDYLLQPETRINRVNNSLMNQKMLFLVDTTINTF